MSCSSDFWVKEAAGALAGFGTAAQARPALPAHPHPVPVSVMAAERDSYPGSGHVCVHDPGLTVMKLFIGESAHTHVTERRSAVLCLSFGFLDF